MENKKTVSEFVNLIKNTLESQFRYVIVEGEVSNLSHSSAGHWYFTLSDRQSSVSVALFKMDALRNSIIKTIKNGDHVVCHGQVGVYAKKGTFQLIAKQIQAEGKGSLLAEFEKLKTKLKMEGLFDIESKKTIPSLPKKVAVITAEKGAALQDFLNIYKRRSLWMNVTIIPAVVQGDNSAKSLRDSLYKAIDFSLKNPSEAFEVIVLTRGGGSLEDLWSFNDEGLAWDIYNSPIPIISAVGHQVDFSIADYVADLRCETPSAAAEILTEHQMKLRDRISSIKKSLISYSRETLSSINEKVKSNNPKNLYNIIYNNFLKKKQRLMNCSIEDDFDKYLNFYDYTRRLDDTNRRLGEGLQGLYNSLENRLKRNNDLLIALNPKGVLKRGYCYIEDRSGAILGSKEEFDKIDHKTKINFKDGTSYIKRI